MFIVHVIVGATLAAAALILWDLARQKKLQAPAWGWVLTGIGLLYAAFVIEVIASFIIEGNAYLATGAYQAALVSGIILGLIAVIWGVLLGRFVFKLAIV